MFSVKIFHLVKEKSRHYLRFMHNGGMIKIGTMIRVGLRMLCVDEICPTTGNLFCIDRDGEEFEVRTQDVDAVNPWNWDSRDSKPNS